jgi:hypothetical protein
VRKKANNMHYLCESYRNEEGKPRQRVLAYLGRFSSIVDARNYHLNEEQYWAYKACSREAYDDDVWDYCQSQADYHLEQWRKLERLLDRWQQEQENKKSA